MGLQEGTCIRSLIGACAVLADFGPEFEKKAKFKFFCNFRKSLCYSSQLTQEWIADYEVINSEEDGVNNESVENNALYTQPEDIYQIYKTLSPISPFFSIAAGFGNCHGVYKPGKDSYKNNL